MIRVAFERACRAERKPLGRKVVNQLECFWGDSSKRRAEWHPFNATMHDDWQEARVAGFSHSIARWRRRRGDWLRGFAVSGGAAQNEF